MDGRLAERRLAAYLDGRLAPAAAARLERAVAAEPALAAKLRELAALGAALRALPTEALPKGQAAGLRGALAREARRGRSVAIALAAYADGELSPAQRRFVEERLLPAPRRRELLEGLLSLRTALRSLSAPADTPAADAVANALAALRGERPRVPAAEELSACLDGEADAATAARMKERLATSPRARRLARDWRKIGAALAALPREAAPATLLANALAALPPGPLAPQRAPAGMPRPWVAAASWAAALSLAGLALWLGAGPMRPRTAELAARPADRPALPASAPGAPAPKGIAGRSPPAPGLDAPLIDDDAPGPRALAGPPAPATAQRLQDLLRPGQVVSGGRVEFVCVNVERMHDRLRAIFVRHQVAVRSDHAAKEAGDDIVRTEIDATPEQLEGLLASLRQAEDRDHLVAALEVRPPPAPEKAIAARMTVAPLPPGAPAPKEPPVVAAAPAPETSLPKELPADALRRVVFVLRTASRSNPALPNG